MIPEHQIQQAQRHIHHADVMMDEAAQLDDIAAQLMAVQRHWTDPSRPLRLMRSRPDWPKAHWRCRWTCSTTC